jgi:hypothetical protein
MIILQILLALGSFGVGGFILYWIALLLHAGPEIEQEAVDLDPRI